MYLSSSKILKSKRIKICALLMFAVFILFSLIKAKHFNAHKELEEEQEANSQNQHSQHKPVDREYLYVYGKPENAASVLLQVDSFTPLTLIENQQNWLKVRSKISLPVWVASDNLSINNDHGTLINTSIIHSVPINVTKTIAGELAKDSNVKIVENRGDWSQILTPKGFTAWINKNELNDFSPKFGISTTEFLSSIQPTNTINQTIHTDKDLIPNNTDLTINSTPSKLDSKSTPKTAIKQSASSRLSIYRTTNINSRFMTAALGNKQIRATEVTIKKGGVNWQKIKHLNGFHAWLSADYLKINNTKNTGVTTTKVNIRTKPLIHRDTLFGQVKKGHKFSILDKVDGWIKVTAPKEFTAWVNSQEL